METAPAAAYHLATNLHKGGQFHFVQVQGPDDAGDKRDKRLARSHAVKHALENKRKLQRESADNFRAVTVKDKPGVLVAGKRRRRKTPVEAASLFSPSAGALDPFQSLAVDSSRLQTLLGSCKFFLKSPLTAAVLTPRWQIDKARLAPEPVFSYAEDLAFQSFRAVFKTGLADPALSNALMLSLAFAATGGSIDRECLGYKGQVISRIRERMESPCAAASESTIGAILLLTGVEVSYLSRFLLSFIRANVFFVFPCSRLALG